LFAVLLVSQGRRPLLSSELFGGGKILVELRQRPWLLVAQC
jgi:hypothetical protein